MAPHADATSSAPNGTNGINGTNGVAAPDPMQKLEKPDVAPSPNGLRRAPLRHGLSPLFEDNITAKIIKTAVNGLVDNVSFSATLRRAG